MSSPEEFDALADLEAWDNLDLRDGVNLLLWLAHEFAQGEGPDRALAVAWRVLLPGKPPRDQDHFLDNTELIRIRDAQRQWPTPPSGVREQRARWYGFGEGTEEMGQLIDIAKARGFEVLDHFDLDVCVLDPGVEGPASVNTRAAVKP